MKKLILLALFLTAGCAAAHARLAVPLETVPPVTLMLGINDGPAVPPDAVARYCSYGRDFIVRAPVTSPEAAVAAMAALASCPRLHSLWLVEKADLALVRALASTIDDGPRIPWGVELGNELDLAGLTPQAQADFVGAARTILRDAGYGGNIVIGGVYTVDDHQPQDFEDYLAPSMAACPDCFVALHWYGDTSDYWLSRVQHLHAQVFVTEFGLPSCTPEQDVVQDVYLREQLAAYARPGNVRAAIVYQRNSAAVPCDGSDLSHLAHFGLERETRTPDGSPDWKEGERVFIDQ